MNMCLEFRIYTNNFSTPPIQGHKSKIIINFQKVTNEHTVHYL